MPKGSLEQRLVIANLNKYLEWHNLPVRMNKGGICKGLACVHTKYVLEGREEEYFALIKKIAVMDKVEANSDELNHLVADVVLTLIPHVWDKAKHQRHSIEALQIDYKRLKSSFNFSLITYDPQWINIFQRVNLRTDEVMLINFANHTINIRAVGAGQYKIYDPNYDTGFKIVNGEEELIAELHVIAKSIGLKEANLGMQMEIIRHPDNPRPEDEPFPDLKLIYKNIAPEANLRTPNGQVINNFFFAARNDDVIAFNHIIAAAGRKKSPITNEVMEAANIAVTANSPKVLQEILNSPELLKVTPRERDKKLVALINLALITGRKEAFDVLLQNPRAQTIFYRGFLNIEHAGEHINYAAEGGNVELLKKIIEQYKVSGFTSDAEMRMVASPLTPQQIAKKILEPNEQQNDAIRAAIKSGGMSGISNTDCVQYLFEQLKIANHPVHEKQMHDYLLLAIKTNQPHMVNLLIKEIQNMPKESQKHIMQSFHMNIPAIERTDLTILRALKNWGVSFSDVAEGVIQQKERRPIGMMLRIGIYLAKFSDWLNETRAKYHIEQFKGFKDDMQKLRATEKSEKTEEVEKEEVIAKESNSPRFST